MNFQAASGCLLPLLIINPCPAKVEVRRLSLPFGSFHAGNGMAPHLPFRSGVNCWSMSSPYQSAPTTVSTSPNCTALLKKSGSKIEARSGTMPTPDSICLRIQPSTSIAASRSG